MHEKSYGGTHRISWALTLARVDTLDANFTPYDAERHERLHSSDTCPEGAAGSGIAGVMGEADTPKTTLSVSYGQTV